MTTTQEAAPPVSLDEETARAAQIHLALLAERRRPEGAGGQSVRWPRLRAWWRWVRLASTRVGLVTERLWRAAGSPRHPIGRFLAWFGLLAKWRAFQLSHLLTAALVATVVGILSLTDLADSGLFWGVVSAGFTASALGLVALFWNDLFRSPFLAWRLRKEIARRPELILPQTPGSNKASLIPRDDPLPRIDRSDVYDEVIPGILAKDRRDVQIIVGEPGSGKTTALVGLAELLARIGMVPVLVPLRGESNVDLVHRAKETFTRQVDARMRSPSDAETLWRWLYRRKRIAVLTDDIDQIGPNGEKGFVLRRTLDSLATEDLPVVVTARPAGIPAGVAASAIDLGELVEKEVVAALCQAYEADPATSTDASAWDRELRYWVAQGRLTEVPFYLELLSHLAAASACPELPAAGPTAACHQVLRRHRQRPGGQWEWNPLWVRLVLLDTFYEEVERGRVRQWLGIEPRERACSLRALEDAALGMLLATGREAQDISKHGPDAKAPARRKLEDFIDADDRAALDEETLQRQTVSAHEAVDTGERLRLLDRNHDGNLQFRHRIMQAYLASRRLIDREGDAIRDREGRKRDEKLRGVFRAARDKDEDDRWMSMLDERIDLLLDRHHPEKLTAHMTLTFAALAVDRGLDRCDARGGQVNGAGPARTTVRTEREHLCEVVARILHGLKCGANARLTAEQSETADTMTDDECRQEGDALPTCAARFAPDTDERTLQLTVTLPLAEPDAEQPPDEPPPGEPSPSGNGAAKDQFVDRLTLERQDWEQRSDPDDALTKLTTAAEILGAIREPDELPEDPPLDAPESVGRVTSEDIVELANQSHGATRWTKLAAIRGIAALQTDNAWYSIWRFMRDPDYTVRRAAGAELERSAISAYRALYEDIDRLIVKAAARSRLALPLSTQQRSPARDEAVKRVAEAARTNGSEPDERTKRALDETAELPWDVYDWHEKQEVMALKALGWVLPAIVSGLREDPLAHTRDEALAGEDPFAEASPNGHEQVDMQVQVHRARRALERLVVLAFEGGHHDLEASLAQGFKGDALRHADDPDKRVAGPGWVASNRRLVADLCLENAEFWYARMLLQQALALYAIVGANLTETLETFSRLIHRERDVHPYPRRAARLSRKAVERKLLGSDRWKSLIWDDEGQVVARRPTMLSDEAARLVGDITLLLNLNEGSSEDRKAHFGYMRELPYCLSQSPTRDEILAKGCPPTCGWGLCPYKQPPPDEPNAHRGVSRAFCRHQRHIATRGPVPRSVRRSAVAGFWHEMERRART